MSDEISRDHAAAEQDSVEARLARAEERLAFYASFDKLIQDNIARSGELMRDALALREQATADVRRAQAEIGRVQAEAERAVSEAERAAAARAEAERRRYADLLRAVHGDVVALQDATAAIARRVASVLGELGVAAFVPVAWADTTAGAAATADAPVRPSTHPTATDLGEPVVEAMDGLPAGAAAEVAAQDELGVDAEPVTEAEPSATNGDAEAPGAAWNLPAGPEEAGREDGQLIVYSGIGTGELRLAADEPAAAADLWQEAVPAYPSAEDQAAEAPSGGEQGDADLGEPVPLGEPETAVLAAPGDDAGEPRAEVEPIAVGAEALEPSVTGEAAAGAATAVVGEPEVAAAAADAWPAPTASDAARAADAATTGEAPTSADGEPATDRSEPMAHHGALPPLRDAGSRGAPAAAPAFDAAVAVGPGPEPEPELEPGSRAVMVLVHGVPRAAAALSLQRHLAGLPHVEAVEAREYAEGILRLQVTATRPLDLEDLRAWDGSAGLEPVHVRDSVVEVRLPGVHGL